ncbi:hypothetical protein GGTG_03657 [Gaeumannomyces tritici R3-111a-1]|uniref:C2H2-type domain-containing protein n=1 Tax=Gaeumannomyces tritici (strain R3-111a-1) TaxID=644352 RepID=J3NQV1_GAET3|nr:hypothetical protein GGTG_03657 [Gaeumannomyces tritici R3-111a-1]EJT78557.1 hypothetical protein GGTG_03657 [Gaeumannomyces tritici R3-111a-1]
MDWPRDNLGLSDDNLDAVFKYTPRDSAVVQILQGQKYKLQYSSLESDKEWEDWLSNDLPKLDGKDSGLVLILAKRPGEVPFPPVKKAPSNEWVKFIEGQRSAAKTGGAWGSNVKALTALEMPKPTAAAASEKEAAAAAAAATTLEMMATAGKTSRRGVRTLPFSKATFKRVAEGMHTHGSIARVVSRADVPVFSADRVLMGGGEAAWVYSCRSSHAWDFDLALSVTYFPGRGLTFVTVYGCYLSACDEILRRLDRMQSHEAVAHPLLLPGIFAELEHGRHMALVNATIAEVESRIFELNALQEESEQRRRRGAGAAAADADKKNMAKRNAWLDTTYLRNGLVSWNAQLAKMAQHALEIDPVVDASEARLQKSRETTPEAELDGGIGIGIGIEAKIRKRIQSIREEYDDWTRDCTMRVDGMAMATQWAQGEVNVEIAFDTKRDSQHMRSIALLTMVFLPGTFLASVFSMTFFDWKEGASVSEYIWIYFVIAILLTLIVIGVWWYWIVYRPSQIRSWIDDDEDEFVPLTSGPV